MSERTAVYRLFDASNALLYVGISKRIGTRWEQHARAQPWWPLVTHQTVTWHPSREDAETAEKAVIRDERPVHNRRDSPWMAVPKDDGTGFHMVPKVRTPRKPGKPKNKHRMIRFSDEDWADFGVLAEQMGSDRSALLRDLAHWWLGHKGAARPKRPPAELCALTRPSSSPGEAQ
jgi:predicted GIY-YIG superfamily endonuclease